MHYPRSLIRLILVLVAFIVVSLSSVTFFLYVNAPFSSDMCFSPLQTDITKIESSNLPHMPFLDNLFFYNTFTYDIFSLESISAFINYNRDVLLQYDGLDINRQLIDIQNFNWNASVLQNTSIGFFGALGHLTMTSLPDYFPYFFPIISNLNANGLLIVGSPKPLDSFKQDIRQIEVALDPLNLSLSFSHCSWTTIENQTLSYAVWHAQVSQALLDSISVNEGLANLLNGSEIAIKQGNTASIAFIRSSLKYNNNYNYSFRIRVQHVLPRAAEDNKFYTSDYLAPISPNRDHNMSLGIVVAPPSSETELDVSLLEDKVRPRIDFPTVSPWFNGETINLINPFILPLNRTSLEQSNLLRLFDGPQFMEIAIYNIHIKSPETNDYVNMGFSNRTDIRDLGFTIEKAPYISQLTPAPTAELQLEIQSESTAITNQTIQVTVTATNQGSKAALMPISDSYPPHKYGIFVSFSGFPYDLIIDDYITIGNISYPMSGDFLVMNSCFEKEILLYTNSFSFQEETLEVQPIYSNQDQSWTFEVSSNFPGELEINSAYAGYLSIEEELDESYWLPTPFPLFELNQSPFFGLGDFIDEIPIPIPLLSESIPTYFCFSISNSLEIMVETEETTSFIPSPFFVGNGFLWGGLIISSSLFFVYLDRKKNKR